LCRSAAVTPRTLSRAFRAIRGMTPYRYLQQLRLSEVRRALSSGSDAATVTEAASGRPPVDQSRSEPQGVPAPPAAAAARAASARFDGRVSGLLLPCSCLVSACPKIASRVFIAPMLPPFAAASSLSRFSARFTPRPISSSALKQYRRVLSQQP